MLCLGVCVYQRGWREGQGRGIQEREDGEGEGGGGVRFRQGTPGLPSCVETALSTVLCPAPPSRTRPRWPPVPGAQELLAEGVDLLVATPGRLQKHLEESTLELDDCRLLVLDEVDVIMGGLAEVVGSVGSVGPAALRVWHGPCLPATGPAP